MLSLVHFLLVADQSVNAFVSCVWKCEVILVLIHLGDFCLVFCLLPD